MSAPDHAPNAQASGAARGGALALLVEDNQTLTSTLEALLDDEGYTTQTSELLKAHGGRVWLDSAPNKGTTVSFSLPRAS